LMQKNLSRPKHDKTEGQHDKQLAFAEGARTVTAMKIGRGNSRMVCMKH